MLLPAVPILAGKASVQSFYSCSCDIIKLMQIGRHIIIYRLACLADDSLGVTLMDNTLPKHNY